MKKKLFVLSAFFLLASPVLAGEGDEVFYPPSQGLTINQESKGVVWASDHQEVVDQKQETGLWGKMSGFALSTISTAQKIVTTPVNIFGQIFGRDKAAETVLETPKVGVQEGESWAKLDLDSVPDFSLEVKAKPFGYSESEKSEGSRLANMSTSGKKGQGSRMLKVQILLQDIVSTDEK